MNTAFLFTWLLILICFEFSPCQIMVDKTRKIKSTDVILAAKRNANWGNSYTRTDIIIRKVRSIEIQKLFFKDRNSLSKLDTLLRQHIALQNLEDVNNHSKAEILRSTVAVTADLSIELFVEILETVQRYTNRFDYDL
jgi:hypothetical protein